MHLTLTFSGPLNVSCQVGDSLYFVNTTNMYKTDEIHGNLAVYQNSDNAEYIGPVLEIINPTSSSPSIITHTALPSSLNDTIGFVFFSKDNKANLSSILGYYADVKFENNSTEYAEMFTAAVDTFNSSYTSGSLLSK